MKRFLKPKSLEQIQHALKLADSLSEFVFHLGYQGFLVPRGIRKLFAKSELHKAWIAGFYGGGILPVMERNLPEELSSDYPRKGVRA